ncbi:MAG: dGTP triphosphohydrolase, partial [Alphaproteobacteria bacterium]
MLASYACDPAKSKGRLHREPESDTRTVFQRDRDRIIHSTAFRRLEYKTQVFVNHEGDHYRTRLTHSLEVSQLARSTSRMLGLNEDLAEAVALAHDLGHTPFGHAGEDALSEVMEPFGGFDHNAHTIRIITSLEKRYAEFDGLNLTWETLEGTAKHNGPLEKPNPSSIFSFFKNFNVKKTLSKTKSKEETYGGPPSQGQSEVPVRVSRAVHGDMSAFEQGKDNKIPRAIAEYNERHNLDLDGYAGAEAQIASLCDDIAYNNHDIDDGLRAGLFTLEQLSAVAGVGGIFREVRDMYPAVEQNRIVHESIRRLIHSMVVDVIGQTNQNIESFGVETADDIRRLGKPLVHFSDEMQE